jgi:hypothetical protein
MRISTQIHDSRPARASGCHWLMIPIAKASATS